MKFKKLSLIFLCLLILPFTFALTITEDVEDDIFYEPFNYTGSFTSKSQWDNFFCIGGAGGCPTYPYNTSNLTTDFAPDGLVYGWNWSSATINYMQLEGRNIWSPAGRLFNNTNNTKTIIAFDYWQNNLGYADADDMIRIWLAVGANNNKFFQFELDPDNNWYVFNYISGGDSCSKLHNLTYGTKHEFVMVIDWVNGVYDVYIDQSNTGCSVKQIGTPTTANAFDGILMTIYGDGAAGIKTFIDNLRVYDGDVEIQTVSGLGCEFPKIFCDDFAYTTPYIDNDWLPQKGGGLVDVSLAPINNEMRLLTKDFISMYHDVDPFSVDIAISEGLSLASTTYSPVFGSSFNLNHSSGIFSYSGFDASGKSVFDIQAHINNGTYSIYYRNSSLNVVNISGGNYTNLNQFSSYQIHSYFTQNAFMDFNSTISKNYVIVSRNNITLAQIPFINNNSVNLVDYYFTKQDDSNFTIDDYYVYVGVDPNYDTSEIYYNPFYTPEDTTTTIGNGTGDLITSIDNMWSQFGIRSTGSKILIALVILFLAVGAIFMNYLHHNQSPNVAVIGFIALVVMIILVYVGLLPIWIPIVLTVLTAGIGAFAYARQASGG